MDHLIFKIVTAYPDIMKTAIIRASDEIWYCAEIFFDGQKLNMSPETFSKFKDDTIKLSKLCEFGQAYNDSVECNNVTLWKYDTSDYNGNQTRARNAIQKVFNQIQKWLIDKACTFCKQTIKPDNLGTEVKMKKDIADYKTDYKTGEIIYVCKDCLETLQCSACQELCVIDKQDIKICLSCNDLAIMGCTPKHL